jgi:hypothetical protein
MGCTPRLVSGRAQAASGLIFSPPSIVIPACAGLAVDGWEQLEKDAGQATIRSINQ